MLGPALIEGTMRIGNDIGALGGVNWLFSRMPMPQSELLLSVDDRARYDEACDRRRQRLSNAAVIRTMDSHGHCNSSAPLQSPLKAKSPSN
mmetsp:Transcript_27418/g.50935  ORF Transcript_27418/g.50935 Transcript_27418/m.50935 type:complete len:91 (-) Transcript_27418:260-532(-)